MRMYNKGFGYDCGADVADAPPELRGEIEAAYRRGYMQGASRMSNIATEADEHNDWNPYDRESARDAFFREVHEWRLKGYSDDYQIVEKPPAFFELLSGRKYLR